MTMENFKKYLGLYLDDENGNVTFGREDLFDTVEEAAKDAATMFLNLQIDELYHLVKNGDKQSEEVKNLLTKATEIGLIPSSDYFFTQIRRFSKKMFPAQNIAKALLHSKLIEELINQKKIEGLLFPDGYHATIVLAELELIRIEEAKGKAYIVWTTENGEDSLYTDSNDTFRTAKKAYEDAMDKILAGEVSNWVARPGWPDENESTLHAYAEKLFQEGYIDDVTAFLETAELNKKFEKLLTNRLVRKHGISEKIVERLLTGEEVVTPMRGDTAQLMGIYYDEN